ncbi:phosphomannomutase [Methanothermobacter sp. K4]|uniref:phosphomannomutase n=1 Tax=Methanothermobacter sp. K4 TaxID=2913262 RepID=UPI001EDB00D2|nr:phosphomannomutase [Methanothermobacter sp. K4]MCG2829255.1 phosphomannomutase [Methanothermobacter sp. K4]
MARYVQDIRGSVNRDIDCSFALSLGMLIGDYVSCRRVLIGRDAHTPSQMIKRAIGTGLMAAGVDVIDFGVATVPVIHHHMERFDSHLMINVSRSPLRADEINIKLLSNHEIPLEQRPTVYADWNQLGKLRYVNNYLESYVKSIFEFISPSVGNHEFMVVLGYDEGSPWNIEGDILNQLNCQTINITFRGSLFGKNFPLANASSISMIADVVRATGADMGVILDNDRDTIFFIDERGELIRDQTVLSIFADHYLKSSDGPVVSSVVASKSLENVTGGRLIRTSVNNVLNKVYTENAAFGGDEPGMYIFPEFQYCYDATFALLKMLEIMAERKMTLHKLASGMERYSRVEFSMECPNEFKDSVIERLAEHFRGKKIELIDGIRVEESSGVVLIRPSRFEPLIRIYIESESSEETQKKSRHIMNLLKSEMSDLYGD